MSVQYSIRSLVGESKADISDVEKEMARRRAEGWCGSESSLRREARRIVAARRFQRRITEAAS